MLCSTVARSAGLDEPSRRGVRAQFGDELNVDPRGAVARAARRFGHRPGHDIDLHRVGYLFALTRQEDVAAFEAAIELQHRYDVPSRLVDPSEAQRLSPLLETDDVLAAAYSPDDGHCSPEGVVAGYAAGARRHGATILTGMDVESLEVDAGPKGVRTAQGLIEADVVVCCAGAWSREIAATAGVDLAVTPYRRQVVVTEAIPDLPAGFPMTIDYATSFYFHREGPGLLMGMSDPDEPPGFATNVDNAFLDKLA